MRQCAKLYFQSNRDTKWAEKSTAGKGSCRKGSLNNTMKNKQKYTLIHEKSVLDLGYSSVYPKPTIGNQMRQILLILSIFLLTSPMFGKGEEASVF